MVQAMIADSWIELQQFRLLVLQTAWKIDRFKDYKQVRTDISAVKAAMPKVPARSGLVVGLGGREKAGFVTVPEPSSVRDWAWPPTAAARPGARMQNGQRVGCLHLLRTRRLRTHRGRAPARP